MGKWLGFVFAAATGVIWGGQWVIGKSALGRVDAFNLTTIRYAVAAAVLLAVLVAVEGRRALSLDGQGLRLFALGTLGFAGFNLLAYKGLDHARPESASTPTRAAAWHRTPARPRSRVRTRSRGGRGRSAPAGPA